MPGEGLPGGKSGFRLGGVPKSMKIDEKSIKNHPKWGPGGPSGGKLVQGAFQGAPKVIFRGFWEPIFGTKLIKIG